MKRDFNVLGQGTFDLIVIGGGIIGTGVARDAALRGLHTLLVENEDFAYGTTSRSTRLIHGGLRYLRMLDFKLVRQDLREREILLDIAPHLVHRLEFIIPLLRRTPFYRFILPFGLRLYNALSMGTSLPSCHRLSKSDTLQQEPALADTEGLKGAYLYYDCQAESNTSRAYKLIDHERQDGIRGFVSILGGKNTAYRGIAEEAVDLVCKKLGIQANCTTAHTPLPGAPAVPEKDMEKAAMEYGLPPETIAHLTAIYGSRYTSVLKYASEDNRLRNTIAPNCPDILAQIKHAVVEEQALTVNDFMLRRSFISLGPKQGLDAVGTAASEMGALLGWNEAEIIKQAEDYRAAVAMGQRFRT